MKDKTVAILESRMRDHIASLVRKYGGTPFSPQAGSRRPTGSDFWGSRRTHNANLRMRANA
jgi:hypothetical protein